MNIVRILTVVLLLVPVFSSHSQGKVCESKVQDAFSDLNTIGKCAIENFKKSKNNGYVKIATRNRYVRKKSKSYVGDLKNKIKAISKTSKKATINNQLKVVENKGLKASKKVEVKVVEQSKVVLVKDFVRFDEVTNIPVFITCAGYGVDDKKACVKETFVANVLENLIYPFDAASEGIEGVVWVRFIIDKNGYINNITTKGPPNGILLEKEANRLISLLPKFVPGKHNDSYVNVEYFMPIDFQLD